MENKEIGVYDEDKAIAFIRKAIPAEISDKYTDDDLLFVIDTIWDYYESKGLTSLDAGLTEDELIDTDDLTAYVLKEIKKDGVLIMDKTDINFIVKAELEYEETLDIFGD